MTRTPLAPIAAAGLCLTATHHADASALNFAAFDPGNWSGQTEPTGTLDDVGFTITSGALSWSSEDFSADLTSSTYDSEGGANQAAVSYINTTSFTIEFDSAVDDLSLYLVQFRTDRTSFGAAFYDFGRSDFTLNHDFEGGTKSGTGIDTDSSVTFTNGIVRFAGPVTSLTVAGTITGWQAFTFSGSASASAVPGAGLAGLATVGLAGISRQRRR